MNEQVTLEGFSELEQTLLEISKEFKRSDLLVKNVFRPAMEEALKPILNQVQADAPYDENRKSNLDANGKVKPHLRDTAKIDTRVPTEADRRSIFVRDTDAYIAVVSVKKSAVSLAQEFGTANLSPKPFIRDAFDGNVQNVTTTLKSKLSETLPAYLVKLRRYGRLK